MNSIADAADAPAVAADQSIVVINKIVASTQLSVSLLFFRCCSFAAAAAISLSSIADADAVDRSTTVVAAIDPDPEFRTRKL